MQEAFFVLPTVKKHAKSLVRRFPEAPWLYAFRGEDEISGPHFGRRMASKDIKGGSIGEVMRTGFVGK